MYTPIEQVMILLIWVAGLSSVFVLAILFEELQRFRRWWRENTPGGWKRHD